MIEIDKPWNNMPQVTLLKGRDKSVRKHHPWIFSGGVESISKEVSLGETVAVMSKSGECLGYGSYSPQSQIRIRMISFDAFTIPNEKLISSLVEKSVERRSQFLKSEKSASRLINAEADNLPGVVADYYDGFIVLQLTSAGAEFWKNTIVKTLSSFSFVKGVSARGDVEVRKKEGLKFFESLEILSGEEPPEFIEIREGEVKFFVDARKGHKTGFYLDQRDARAEVAKFSKHCEVLNCFSYTGGFGLAAASGGAKKVTQVDVSTDALELAKKNASLIPGALEKTEFIEADVFMYLRKCRDSGKTFDLIVLDPPKFAESKSQIMKAARGYKDINLCAMKLLRPGGILATFSCSGAMTTELFEKVVFDASIDAKRDFQIISTTRQAADHPVSLSFPEGFYLKGLILKACN